MSQTVVAGDTVVFTVAVNGTPTPTLQWFKDGLALGGAISSTLSLVNVSTGNVGAYTVVATNSAGTQASSPATLTVTTIGAYQGTYSGGIGSGDGRIVVYVRPDGTAVLLAYLSDRNLGFVVNLTLDPSGNFQSVGTQYSSSETRGVAADAGADRNPTVSATTSPSFRGRIMNGVLTGTIDGLNVSFAASATPATSTSVSGFYTMAALGTAPATTYVIICTDRTVVSLTTDAKRIDGGVGTVSASGSLSITTASSKQITGSVNSSTGQLSASVTSAGSPPVAMAGLADNTPSVQRLGNISVRARVDSGDNVLIAGFVIQGSEPKQVLIRAAGPGLSNFGLSGALAEPKLQLFQGSSVLLANNGWSSAINASAIAQASTAAGAFSFAARSGDSAMLTTLAPGAYTAVVSSSGGSGVALVEVYETSGVSSRLINLSARTVVGKDSEVLIAGVVITGNTPKKLLIRAVGPTLASFGVSGSLADPQLQVYQESTIIAQNDNWTNDTAVEAAANQVGAFALPAASKDAGLVITLAPGGYTIVVSGVGGTSGVALVETYEVP